MAVAVILNISYSFKVAPYPIKVAVPDNSILVCVEIEEEIPVLAGIRVKAELPPP